MKSRTLLAFCLVGVVLIGVIRGSPQDETTTTKQDAFICPNGFDLFESSCYRLVSDSPTDGTAARSACQQLVAGGHLAFIRSQSVQNYLQTLARETGAEEDYWIGLTYASDLAHPRWLDGSAVGGFTAWDSYGDFDESSPCVRLREASHYLWNDRPCHYRYGYACQTKSIIDDKAEPTIPAPQPAPTVESQPENDGAVDQAKMAAPRLDRLVQALRSAPLLRCALYCLKHGGCADADRQRVQPLRTWDRLRSFCETWQPKGLAEAGNVAVKTVPEPQPVVEQS